MAPASHSTTPTRETQTCPRFDVPTSVARMPEAVVPPACRHVPHAREHHEDRFDDDFEWLRDKDDPAVIAHLEAENAYTEARTAHLAPLRQAIFDDIKARTQETDLSVPEYAAHEDGSAYWYYARMIEGQSYPLYCRIRASSRDERPDPEAGTALEGEQILLDCNAEAQGHAFFALGAFDVSPGGQLLAWSSDTAGDERYTLRVRDLRTGGDLADQLDDVGAGASWLGDDYLFYSRVDDAWRPFEVWRHRLGSPDDALVVREDDERFWVGHGTSRDQQWLAIGMGSSVTTEYRLIGRADPTAEPRIVCPRRDGLEYHVEIGGEQLFIVHNDEAPDFAVAIAPLTASTRDDWTPLIDHVPGVRVGGVSAYADYLVVELRRDGLTGIDLYERAGASLGERRALTFDEPVYAVWADSDTEHDTDRITVTYESLVTPRSVLECRLADGNMSVLKRTPVLDHPEHGPYVGADYVQERLWATAEDGTAIPVSIVRHKDTPLDGTAPCLLYGYGSYEVSVAPSFSISRLALLDRGFVYAIAHVRGGGELGRAWYEAGRLAHKRHTFTDFVDVARHLVEHGYTAPDRLAARGRSAGGLLVGAVANLAPDLFRAIHAGVPFVDALTTILDPSLPLTVGEWDEWGDPLHDAQVYAYMKGYSPYENIAARQYPAILATTSLNDTRVYFVEPAKWVARLRETVTNGPDRPILLRTEMVAGHGGVSGRYDAWREEAFELAWLIDQVT